MQPGYALHHLDQTDNLYDEADGPYSPGSRTPVIHSHMYDPMAVLDALDAALEPQDER